MSEQHLNTLNTEPDGFEENHGNLLMEMKDNNLSASGFNLQDEIENF